MSRAAFLGHRSVTRLAVVALVTGLVTVLPAAARAASTTSTWHMDETSGSTMADSTGGHPGTLTKVGLGVAGDPAYPGTAYHFNGSTAKVTVPNASSLNPQGSDLHIALSMRTTSVPASPDFDLVRKGAFPQQEFKVELQPSGQVSCEMVGSSGGTVVLGKPDVHDGSGTGSSATRPRRRCGSPSTARPPRAASRWARSPTRPT